MRAARLSRLSPGYLGVGVGLRAAHYRDFVEGTPAVDWVEVHSENYFGDGGWDRHVLGRVRERWPVSLHGVGLGLGSAVAPEERHLDKLARLVREIEPALISEHLCWGASSARHLNDLLPLAYNAEALACVAERIDLLQERLGRPVLVENVSAYIAFADSDVPEGDFIAELTRRTGCGVLLDVNNLYVNEVNLGTDARSVMAAIPPRSVAEIHLAGHLASDHCLVDTHGDRVSDAVWTLYEEALARFGLVPTLIEWDTDIPTLDVLVGEADAARARMGARHAVAA